MSKHQSCDSHVVCEAEMWVHSLTCSQVSCRCLDHNSGLGTLWVCSVPQLSGTDLTVVILSIVIDDQVQCSLLHFKIFVISLAFSGLKEEACLELLSLYFFSLFFQRFYLLISERGGEGEREGEKHQCAVAFHVPFVGDLACNPSICPDWELNQQHFGSQAGAQSTEPHQPGHLYFFSLVEFNNILLLLQRVLILCHQS